MPVFVLCGYAACDEYPYVGAMMDIVAAENGVGGLSADDNRLREESAKILLQNSGATQVKLTNVLQREISREKLLELAAQARTRAEILAERVATSDI